VDKNGDSLPWYTYAAVAFLEPRIHRGMSVFEYGSGNSTLWWSSRVGRVVGCEHRRKWYRFVAGQAPANVHLILAGADSGKEYSTVVGGFENEFDIVVLDGRERVACARNCLPALKPGGVVIWDNSDRESYLEGIEFLTTNGFKRLDFAGPGPVDALGWCTTIFYKPGNCLGI
jgi:tRNA A58 N-methylase Trm61